MVLGDRTRLQQVILNLVSNAVKFTEQGSVSLWVESGKKEVVIAVSDSGLGIPAAEQETIFNEFKQSERTARRGYGGMGLGLAISRRLVELHGGQIGVLSTGSDGAGSTFYLAPCPSWRHQPAMSQPRSGRLGADGCGAHRTCRRGHPPDQLSAWARCGFTVETVAIAEEAGLARPTPRPAPPGAVVLEQGPATERGAGTDPENSSSTRPPAMCRCSSIACPVIRRPAPY